jgi:hypothetical protein
MELGAWSETRGQRATDSISTSDSLQDRDILIYRHADDLHVVPDYEYWNLICTLESLPVALHQDNCKRDDRPEFARIHNRPPQIFALEPDIFERTLKKAILVVGFAF